MVDDTYQHYLKLHPRSSHFRTLYLRAAYLSGHQDIVSAQYKLLANNWDDYVLSDDEYRAIRASVGN